MANRYTLEEQRTRIVVCGQPGDFPFVRNGKRRGNGHIVWYDCRDAIDEAVTVCSMLNSKWKIVRAIGFMYALMTSDFV